MPTSNWSPMTWPRLSFTSLKRSRSRNSTAYRLSGRRLLRRSSTRLKRSRNSTRLGRPVSAIGHLALRDVGQRPGHAITATVAVADRQPARQHPAIAAVLVAAGGARSRTAACALPDGARSIRRSDVASCSDARDRAIRPAAPTSSLLLQPEHQLPTRRVVERASPQVPVPDAVVRAASGERVALLALAQRRGGLLQRQLGLDACQGDREVDRLGHVVVRADASAPRRCPCSPAGPSP